MCSARGGRLGGSTTFLNRNHEQSHCVVVVAAFLLAVSGVVDAAAPAKPNVVWIIVDDMSANLSCYGEKLIETPHVDRMAREGTRFTKTFTTAPFARRRARR